MSISDRCSLPVWYIIIYHTICLSANGIHSDSAGNLAYSDDGKHGISLTWAGFAEDAAEIPGE